MRSWNIERLINRQSIVTIVVIVAAVVMALLIITPDRAAVDPSTQAMNEPVRILDTRFGIGAPATPIGAGRERSIDLGDHPELDLNSAALLDLRVTVTPRSTRSEITLTASTGDSATIATSDDQSSFEVTLPVADDGQIVVAVAGEPVDLAIEVIGVDPLSDGA